MWATHDSLPPAPENTVLPVNCLLIEFKNHATAVATASRGAGSGASNPSGAVNVSLEVDDYTSKGLASVTAAGKPVEAA